MKFEANELNYFLESMQSSLLMHVPGEVRAISFELLGKKLWVRCIFDEDISELNRNIMNRFFEVFESTLFDGYSCVMSLCVSPYPANMTHLPHLVFHRYEEPIE